MTRTPEEVFQHHVDALGAGDLDEIVADYADDAILITPAGTLRGHDSIRATFVEDGIDTFIFGDGLIRLQTVRYTLQRLD